MSYDLVVFEPQAAPKRRQDFLRWYKVVTRWAEPHDYNDPSRSSPALQAWFGDMRGAFPPLNGPYRSELALWFRPDSVTDYSFASKAIYAAFAWSKAERAFDSSLNLARRRRLGFFDASGSKGEVWLPTIGGGYAVAHCGGG